MHTFLIVIAVYGCLGLISASIPSSTIDSDLIEFNKLSEDFKKFSPDIGRQFTEATCQMISQCCPQIQSNFISMSLSGNTQGLADKCFGGKNSSNLLANILSCSPLVKITIMATNPELTKYVSIITNKSVQDKDDIKLILDTCSEKEIYSIACDWNNSDLQSTCQQKILKKLAEQGDQIYKDTVQKMKKRYIKLVDELKKEFNN